MTYVQTPLALQNVRYFPQAAQYSVQSSCLLNTKRFHRPDHVVPSDTMETCSVLSWSRLAWHDSASHQQEHVGRQIDNLYNRTHWRFTCISVTKHKEILEVLSVSMQCARFQTISIGPVSNYRQSLKRDMAATDWPRNARERREIYHIFCSIALSNNNPNEQQKHPAIINPARTLSNFLISFLDLDTSNFFKSSPPLLSLSHRKTRD